VPTPQHQCPDCRGLQTTTAWSFKQLLLDASKHPISVSHACLAVCACVSPGKLNRSADGPQRPEATAARELEEESHGLIPAAASLAVLPSCPQWYCPSSKMVMYMMRYAGGQQLPDLLEQRLAGRVHGVG